MKEVSMMLKAIHAQESKASAREKAVQVIQRLKEMKLSSAAKKLEDGIEETITYMEFHINIGQEPVQTIQLSD